MVSEGKKKKRNLFKKHFFCTAKAENVSNQLTKKTIGFRHRIHGFLS